MKILLTGATGFLGSHLAKALAGAGHQLVLLKRSFSNQERIKELDTSTYDIDLCSLESIFSREKFFNAIIHTSTCYGKKEESPLEIFETNINFPLKLLMLSHPSTFFINTDTFTPKECNFYALSKHHFLEWGKKTKEKFINIRLEHLYGPDDNPLKFTMQLIHHFKTSSTFELTLGQQTRDFIYIDDAVVAYLLILHSLLSSEKKDFSLGTGIATSVRTFVELIHRSLKSKTQLKFGALPTSANEVMDSKADLSALSTLGWAPKISLEEGIYRTIYGN